MLIDPMLHGAPASPTEPRPRRRKAVPLPPAATGWTPERDDAGAGAAAQGGRIARETPLLPHVVAEGVWLEASVGLATPLPREWVGWLAGRAETLYAHNARFRRLLRGPGNRGREQLWAFSRHWLAALLYRHRPGLLARLPAGYARGEGPPASRPAAAAGGGRPVRV